MPSLWTISRLSSGERRAYPAPLLERGSREVSFLRKMLTAPVDSRAQFWYRPTNLAGRSANTAPGKGLIVLQARATSGIALATSFPFYYGWAVVVTLAAFNALSASVAGSRLGLFIKPMGQDLGWSAAVFGWAQMASMVTILVSGPLLGHLIDRYGPRLLVPLVALIGGSAIATLAFVVAPWQMVLIFGITGLMGLGRAADLYGNVVISKWFVRRRGRAIGIAFALSTLGLVIFMPITQWLIDGIGWSRTWLVFGLGAPIVVVPLGLLILRRRPEDIGLLPDGLKQPQDLAEAVQQTPRLHPQLFSEESWTRAQALRTRTFWLMVTGFGIATFSSSIQAVFRVPAFIERGLDAQLVAFAVSADAVAAGLIAAFVSGRLVERFPARYMAVVGFAFLINAALFSIVGDTVIELFVAYLSFGIALSFIMVSENVMWANSFGRTHLGSIRGVTVPLIMVISAIAFPLTGYIRDVVGEYTPAWWISAIGLLVAGLIISQAKPPRHPVASA